MKSKYILTSLAILSATTFTANATTIRPFVGATMGVQNVVYADAGKDFEKSEHVDLPTDFFTFGLEAGARFGEYDKIYNYGFSLNVDKSTYSKIKNKFTDHTYANLDNFAISSTFDNYIRLKSNKRIDLVLGAGLGAFAYHTDKGEDKTLYSFTPVIKVGLDFELTNHITLSGIARVFIPTRGGEYKTEASGIFGGAVKYVF